MRLVKLKLTNYCQYEKYQWDFAEGTTVLRGANGNGKSNLMNAIFFAITGDTLIDKKGRIRMLRWGAKQGTVEVTFLLRGKQYTINRSLHSSAVSLDGPDGLAIHKSQEATTYLETLLKSTPDMLRISAFSPQNGATDLIFGSDLVRQTAFGRLFELAHLEGARRNIKKEYDAIPNYVSNIENIRRLTAELTVEQQVQESSTSLCTSLEAQLIADAPKYQAMVESVGRMTEADHKKTELALAENVRAAEELVVQTEKKLATFQAQIPKRPDEEGYAKYNNALQALQDYEEAEAVLAEKLATMPEDPTADIDATEVKLRENRAERDRLSRDLALCREGVCHTCGQPSPKGPEHESKLLRELNQAEARLKDDLQRKLSLTNLGRTFTERQAEIRALESAQKVRYDRVLPLAEFVSTFDIQAYTTEKKVSTEYDAEAQAKQTATKAANAAVLVRQEALAAQREHALKPKQTVVPDQAFLDLFVKREAQYNEEDRRSINAKARVEAITGSLQAAWKAEGIVDLCNRQRAVIATIRDVLHVDSFPKAVIRSCKEKLASSVNRFLEKFGAPFTVSITDSLAFTARLPGNDSADVAIDLSGAQRAMLIVSVRLAVAEMFTSEVDLLTFDEPGAAMDNRSKQGLLEAFMTVKQKFGGKVQLLVSTHDEQMESVADSVIRL